MKKVSKWPRIRNLPSEDKAAFSEWMHGQTRPWIEGETEEDQDGYCSHDYDRWKQGKPIID